MKTEINKDLILSLLISVKRILQAFEYEHCIII